MFRFMSLFLIISIFNLVNGMESPSDSSPSQAKITYRQAASDDIPELLKMIAGFDDEAKHALVVLPESLREPALKEAIEKGRIFVAATSDGQLVAFKKLFLITENTEEFYEILFGEIRCFEDKLYYKEDHQGCAIFLARPTQRKILFRPLNHISRSNPLSTLFIYNGSDYTLPAHRGQGINAELLRTALQLRGQDIVNTIKAKNYDGIGLVYGLIQELAGGSLAEGRTKSIALVFAEEMQRLLSDTSRTCLPLDCIRFKAYKPEFNDTGMLIPESVSGFGYVLLASTYEYK